MTDATAADRRTTKTGIALGLGGGAALYVLAYLAWPHVAPPVDRLAYGAWLCAAPAVLLYAMFFSCLRLRDTPEALDPLRAAESTRWKINQRVLTNTVEQLAMFLPILLALSTKIDDAHVSCCRSTSRCGRSRASRSGSAIADRRRCARRA